MVRLRRLARDAALAAFAASRPGWRRLPERAGLGACRQECERLTEMIKVRAIELALHGEGNAGALRPGPRSSERADQA